MSTTMTANERALIQPRELPLKVSRELCAGRCYIVTGSNVGLGLEASRHLVAAGAGKVIMAVRNLEAGEEAKQSIEASTGTKDVAEVWKLDLASYSSVQEFASKANKTLGRIDAIIENAAVASGDLRAEGRLAAITVNVISTFLLAALLLPKLRADAAKYDYTPRVSIVTSGTGFDMADYWAQIAEDPIAKMDADADLGLKSYPVSKMMEMLAVREIAKTLPFARGGIVINAICPGVCETTLSRNSPPQFKEHIKQLWEQCGRTAECGSRTLLAGAVAGEESHGSHMSDCVVADEFVPGWMDDTANSQAWNSIAKELEKIDPGCVASALA